MIYWAPFLHFYQPPTQDHSILNKICQESYRPLVKMFLEHPRAKVTINICAVLTEMLNNHGAPDVLEAIKQLARNKQVEFVDSAKYHALLPLIPPQEIQRQIELNHKTNEYFFKDVYKPKGVFPPEMAYSGRVAQVVKTMGYDWVLLSGIACDDVWPLNFISQAYPGSAAIKVLYRDDILSNKISFHNLESIGFLKELANLSKEKKDIYVITAMDAETFGHHIRDWEKLFLARVYETIESINAPEQYKLRHKSRFAGAFNKISRQIKDIPLIKVVTISELLSKFPLKNTKPPRACSWSTTGDDISRKNYYPLWKSPDNPIHKLQWKHLYILLKLVDYVFTIRANDKESEPVILARYFLDEALHSCQFWWANKERGIWNMNMINKGLILQEEALLNAYKAVSTLAVTDEQKEGPYRQLLAARNIANKIRDLLLA